MRKTIVISLGGSLISPYNPDFLKKFVKIIRNYLSHYKFVIVCGGGELAREYIRKAKKLKKISNEDADWIGIFATRLNASMIKALFGKLAYPFIIEDPRKKVSFSNVLIASGWKPGRSTDYDAVLLAKNYKARLINLTNVDYVYDKDPRKFKEARAFKEMSWQQYLNLIKKSKKLKWKPGLNLPFDPIAAKEAKKFSLKVVITNGKKLKNLKNWLEGKRVGTLIK